MIRNIIGKALMQDHPIRVHFPEGEDQWLDGFAVALGDNHVLIELVNDNIFLDGFTCLNLEEVSKIEVPVPHHSFIEKALALRGQKRSRTIEIDMSSLESILKSASQYFEIVTIHPRKLHLGVCYIGWVKHITSEILKIQSITQNGEKAEEIDSYNLHDITQVDFGGAYEEALLLVEKSS